MVAFLTHFPELIALLDLDTGQAPFPDMRPVDVVNEVICDYMDWQQSVGAGFCLAASLL